MKFHSVSIWLLASALCAGLSFGCADPPPGGLGETGGGSANSNSQGGGSGGGSGDTSSSVGGGGIGGDTTGLGGSTGGAGGTTGGETGGTTGGETGGTTGGETGGTTGGTTGGETGGTTGGSTGGEDAFECDPEPEEACDGLDNNCDGNVDEGCSCGAANEQPCYAGPAATINVGICRQGIQECQVEFFGECEGAVLPQGEVCDGLDNDCDGEIDEDFNPGSSCDMGQGSCVSQGVTICNPEGDGVICTAMTVEPGDELCDSLDNDCDGDIDEDFTILRESCTVGVGACANTGIEVCTDDGAGTICSAEPLTPTEELCDGIDNNCNEAIDEAFPELGQTCTVGDGVCARDGTWICAGDGRGVVCDATPGDPEGPEVCDELDNDCDGQVDELPECNNRPPDVVCPGVLEVATLDTATITAQATDPDGDSMTYRWELLSAPIGSGSAPTPTNQLSTSLWMDIAGDFQLRFTATDQNNASSSCETTVRSVPSEQFRVELIWNVGAASDDSDVDLHLLHTGQGGGWEGDDDCHWRNCTGGRSWGAAGQGDDPRLDIDDVDGFGPENINIDNPEDTTYRIGVHYWDEDSFGDSTVILRIYCNAQLIREFEPVVLSAVSANNADNDFWIAADVTWQGPICTVNEFGTPGNRQIVRQGDL